MKTISIWQMMEKQRVPLLEFGPKSHGETVVMPSAASRMFVPCPILKSLPLFFSGLCRFGIYWARDAEPALRGMADFFRHRTTRMWPSCLSGLQSTVFPHMRALQTRDTGSELGHLLIWLGSADKSAAPMLMPSELIGCLCCSPALWVLEEHL